ncbi:VOC family protein [Pseudomonas muyukensis]|uniref:VOC family protein n=1 Tax=Pseudomonas muyukensis TaxID=2842357 RepID=A0ABX8M525_9PSED|nr:VOC family protein [Pseudomonas muyukensis]QXH34064.1 VOC family protein [Pseudomonas muyukensis]
MQLKFSHVDVLVAQLETACAYYQQMLGAEISTTQVWDRGGLLVRYAVARLGQERFMLVQPLAGNLKTLLDQHGEGMIYRHCYSTPDIELAYDQLLAAGVQPEDENGQPLARADLQSPAGARILWLPKRFGHFSIEILEQQSIERFIEGVFASPT